MRQADVSTVNLPEHRVDVVESGTRSRRHWRKCEIGENLKFDTAGLESYCLASWDTRVFDAFVLAGAVQFCDHTKARPSPGWGRYFRLRLPVHEPALWRSATVSEALHGTLEFLTGDRWQIEFTERKQPAPLPRQGQFNMPDGSRIIVPFSDGLDSFVVSGLIERQHRHKLIRVRLGSKSLNGSRMESLQVPFALVPYRVRFGKMGSLETSARSRGFRFALLSGLAAYLSQARQVMMTESGQGALGPTLVPVGQAYEDYRSHPRFTNRMEALLSALFDHEIRYDYPRLWHTKAETIAEFIADFPGSEDWAQTRSCWQGARQVSVSRQRRQCGTCAACMLRRMSVHAIGRAEKEDTYVWEDLSAPRYEEGAASAFENNRPNGALYEYAIAGALHLDHLAGLLLSSPNKVLLDRNVFQLSRSLDLPEEDTRRKLERLLTQHGNEWKNFVHSLGPRSFVAQWALGGS